MFSNAKKSTENIYINNSMQNILTLKTNNSNPILLIVHGGPGSPDRPLVCKYNIDLSNYYTIICWDQRGSGLSYCKDDLSIDLMLNDMKTLVEFLIKKYNQEKIFIAGHSWGAYLGLKFVSLYPQYVKYYIGTGQGISSKKDEIYKYNFVKNEASKKKSKNVIKKLNEFGIPTDSTYPHDNSNAQKYISKLVHKYGGYINPNSNFNVNKYLNLYVKHYGINVFKVINGIQHSLNQLQMEMLENENIDISHIDAPILLIFGEKDYICPVEVTKCWFDNLTAPSKKFVVIDNASHMVNFEQSDKWNKELINLIKE